jgi:hypothetical protein
VRSQRHRPSWLDVLKKRGLQHVFRKYFSWRLSEFTGDQLVALDYPVDATPRYPLGVTPHPELWQWFHHQWGACAHTLASVGRHRAQLEAIPNEAAEPASPQWDNQWFSALDAMSLYTLVADRRPARIIEVGSGNSTKFAVRSILDHGLSTQVTSIDPHPRTEIDGLCQRVIRQPLETVSQAVFSELKGGDFLFIDNSHRAFTNSDVSTFFLEVLPRLS